jgi:hypothetical protein
MQMVHAQVDDLLPVEGCCCAEALSQVSASLRRVRFGIGNYSRSGRKSFRRADFFMRMPCRSVATDCGILNIIVE